MRKQHSRIGPIKRSIKLLTWVNNLFEHGYERRYDIGLEVMKTLRYDRWREYDPTDTIRYFALRLHEVGMIKTSPEKFIAQGADWRFLNELKKELKA